MRVLFILVTFVLLTGPAASLLAQQNDGRQPILEATNISYLKQLARDLEADYRAEREKAQSYATLNGLEMRRTTELGGILQLHRLNPNGTPVYLSTFTNVAAARTTGTNRLQRRQDLGLNLTGRNFNVGIWDGGAVNEVHVEIAGRVTIIDDSPFGTHDTHVAGTIAATGIRPEAQGMAPEALLTSYDFQNDNAEMAEEAASGMLISNHSYGLVSGWFVSGEGGNFQWAGDESISSIEDYKFGYYSAEDSRVWDDITYNAPYYLPVKASGNDRGDGPESGSRPQDGPYDIIEPKGVAKNILTVGAVEAIANDYSSPEDVVMSSFSSWGPVDDGRIKPEVVAVGVNVLSSVSGGGSTNEYGEQSGTSMACPNVSGSLVLLQELHARINGGNYMRSATLKGLAIHTTREAGEAPGPDYEHGFGLLATDLAAGVLLQADGREVLLKERVLANQATDTLTLEASGDAPITVTICWTDPPGNPVPPQLDPDELMLVNDIDVRVIAPDDSVYQPWTLNPARVNQAAVPGDNFRDNVEKIEIPTPTAGTYRIVVTHKGSLEDDEQAYSLIASSRNPDSNLSPLYWIGNNGNWNNGQNWSRNSGGTPAGTVPTQSTPVIFDENSFSGNNGVVTLSGAAFGYNLNWYAGIPGTVNLASETLTINGSIDTRGSEVAFEAGTVNLSGVFTKGNYLNVTANAFAAADLQVDGENARWNMLANLATRSVTLNNGSFSAVNRTITTPSITAGRDGQELDITGSTLVNISNFSVDESLDVKASETRFTISNPGSPVTFDGGGKTYGSLDIQEGTLTVSGDNQFARLSSAAEVTLTGSNVLDTLLLEPGSTLTVPGGTTQEFTNFLEGIATANNPITLQSSNNETAIFRADNDNARFCFDFLNVTNVAAEGSTPFVSGANSTLDDNSTGWRRFDCEDLLFADFEANFLCAQSTARFTDQSTGNPDNWLWNFDDPQFPEENTATVPNPEHQFRFPGTYDVTLDVSNDVNAASRTITLTVVDPESNLTIPDIRVDGSTLSSSISAPNYQWFRNGEPIDGATGQSLEIGGSGDFGSYTVEISDNDCRFRSRPAVINATAAELAGRLKVYPNPSEAEFTISTPLPLSKETTLEVFDLQGRIKNVPVKTTAPHSYKLDLRSFSPGQYLVRITAPGAVYQTRIIKMR